MTAAEIQTVLTSLQTAASRGAGAATVTIDNVTVRYHNPTELTAAISYWQGQLARANGTRPNVATFNLSRAF